jgi:peptidoglycan hydrolase-like protein with peptidoglycan-binding domain
MRKSTAVLLAGLFFGAAAQAQTQPAPCGFGMPDNIYKAYVRTAQLELNLHGYDAGMPDGNATAKTEQAVRDYQRDAKLAEDGCVTKGLVDHLQFVLPKVEKPLGPRSKPLVVEAQTLLSRRGYYIGAVDGVDGGRTRAAARRFLADAKASGSGAVDQALVDSLKSADPAIRGDGAAPP